MRERVAQRAQQRAPGPDLHEVRDVQIDGVLPGRLYRPAAGRLPLVVYLHGGGWIIGSLETHDRACRRLADESGAALLAVDYRLAPEHPWPASVDDAETALRWAAGAPAALGEPAVAVAVAGDSAGGTLATLACLRLRDSDPAALPVLQAMFYATTDLTGTQPSMREKSSGWGLDADTMEFFSSQWVPDRSRWADPEISPLHATSLAGLPPALIITAEHDARRDESEAYARRLEAAGVPVTLRREPGVIHNFLLMDEISPACDAAATKVAADLRSVLSGLIGAAS
jgi:acetyl esterase